MSAENAYYTITMQWANTTKWNMWNRARAYARKIFVHNVVKHDIIAVQ